ncbi:hypothetical protein D6789_03205 [Candidatus Woesearchaeota archaeon]|nr:MAG: hypothetical protein D6789_03205 [Candidatus Woesearchaeota archaeon]
MKAGGYYFLGSILGQITGTIEGVVGSLAVPTSLRCINERIDDTYVDRCFSQNKSIEERIGNFAYLATKLPIRVGMHLITMYQAVENVASVISLKGSIDDIDVGWLLVPNLVSLAYEVGRARHKRMSADNDYQA